MMIIEILADGTLLAVADTMGIVWILSVIVAFISLLIATLTWGNDHGLAEWIGILSCRLRLLAYHVLVAACSMLRSLHRASRIVVYLILPGSSALVLYVALYFGEHASVTASVVSAVGLGVTALLVLAVLSLPTVHVHARACRLKLTQQLQAAIEDAVLDAECAQCGASNSGYSQFCHACGTSLLEKGGQADVGGPTKRWWKAYVVTAGAVCYLVLWFLVCVPLMEPAPAPDPIMLKGNATEEDRLRDEARAKAEQAQLEATHAAHVERQKELGRLLGAAWRKWRPEAAAERRKKRDQERKAEEKRRRDPMVSYTIIDGHTIARIKRSLDVRLNKRVTEEVLRTIAHDLRARDPHKYDRTFISYYLPGMVPSHGGWATTHFNPTLEVRILGLTVEQVEAHSMESAPADRKVVGRWIDDIVFRCRLTIFQKGGKFYAEFKLRSGDSWTEEVIERPSPRGRRFDTMDTSGNGDRFVVDPSGDLQIRDNDGLIATARQVK